jgi:hypothetical protein
VARRIRAGSVWTYRAVLIDHFRPASKATEGQRVRVVKLNGCPPPGTMNHCHVEDAESGEFLGLVCCNSLIKGDK